MIKHPWERMAYEHRRRSSVHKKEVWNMKKRYMRIVSLLLALTMVFGSLVNVYAGSVEEPVVNKASAEQGEDAAQQDPGTGGDDETPASDASSGGQNASGNSDTSGNPETPGGRKRFQ